MPKCEGQDTDSSGCLRRSLGPCITREGVTESFKPPPKALEHFDCPACDYSGSDSDDYDSEDDKDGAGGGTGRQGRHDHRRSRSRRRGGGRGGDDGGLKGRRGRRDQSGPSGGRGRRERSGGREGRDGSDGSEESWSESDGAGGRIRHPGRHSGTAGDDSRKRYRPWTAYLMNTLMLEKLAALAALFLYVYSDTYRWGVLKSFLFFAAGVRSINKVSDAVKKECLKRQKCADLAKYYDAD